MYKLMEQSWDGDAVVRDIERDMYVDPGKVRSINHEGEHFSVVGPLMSEPSPQRTPVLSRRAPRPADSISEQSTPRQSSWAEAAQNSWTLSGNALPGSAATRME